MCVCVCVCGPIHEKQQNKKGMTERGVVRTMIRFCAFRKDVSHLVQRACPCTNVTVSVYPQPPRSCPHEGQSSCQKWVTSKKFFIELLKAMFVQHFPGQDAPPPPIVPDDSTNNDDEKKKNAPNTAGGRISKRCLPRLS